ncbi:Hypothetical protein R9X50_00381000 [Acrodontium crateriforme]|uniref:Uncharacterized protein n=1 Tax=Acrodontium crateriforme TaxID=150365 RepID=A0AAQ3R9Q4_9PEZI|nr:Hypothetical protein R9X50_00381000 [Acrodontium crateriforme]
MRVTITFLLVALLAALAMAVAPQSPVIVSYPEDTPNSVIQEAMEAIKKAGGVITHEYSLIKGFAAKASAKMIETVQAMGSEHQVLIEQDQVVNANSA